MIQTGIISEEIALSRLPCGQACAAFFLNFFYFCFFKTGLLCVALAVLELTL